jgi:S-DNA-T family DNA segregation ATPase FtsK/SpoIIIE
MVDPKMVELKTFDGVPSLVWPVVTEMDKVVGVLKYAVGEMERATRSSRSSAFATSTVITESSKREGKPKLARMVVIIDELADLMMAAPKRWRHPSAAWHRWLAPVGIHLILATQRPSVDVVTGLSRRTSRRASHSRLAHRSIAA